MKIIKTLTLLVVFAILFVGISLAEKAERKGKAQALCPVMGGEINKDVYVDHGGKRVYFCCEGCKAKFKSEPAKYLKKLAEEGVELEKAPKEQTVCPISGKKVNSEVYADYKGKRVYFCCEGCVSAFKKNPEKYIEQMEKKGYGFQRTPKATKKTK